MERPQEANLTEKPIKEQAQILWLAFEDLTCDNLLYDASSPTEEEINNMLMVLVMFGSLLFDAVLSQTHGHIREKIAVAWVNNIGAALRRERVSDLAKQNKNGTGKKTPKEKEN